MRLLLRSILFHFRTHWSSPTNFWSGIFGMCINNALVLLGIWAMLFAGKENLHGPRDSFFLMNFILMFAWGLIHVFLGGIARLDTQINEGGLDLALATPRNPFFMLSLTASELPAWGDLLIGFLGLAAYAMRDGALVLFHGLLISLFATITLYAFFLFVGTLAFWFRRTDSAHSVLVNMFLAFNTYPVFRTDGGPRWILFFIPALLAGVIPAAYVSQPSLSILAGEAAGSVVFLLFSRLLFGLGIRRYQSSSVLGTQRT